MELKRLLIRVLEEWGHQVLDLDPEEGIPLDYPDAAARVGRALREGRAERGVLICGSGVGSCIAANKMRGIRASVCHDTYSARQGVEHDDMNVLCLGSRVIGRELAKELVQAFLQGRFREEERYKRRLRKVEALEDAW
jgi:ribose 5-phosphate isomerase B